MHKPIASFSWSTTLFVVLIVQILTIVMLASSLLSIGSADTTPISLLPPLNFIYTAGDAMWIGAGRTVAHLISGGMDIIVGICCIWYATGRRLKLIRYVMMMLGLHFFAAALGNFSIVGLIVYGGWWHTITFVTTVITAATATGSAVVFAMLQGNLRKLGVEHDKHIDLIEQHGISE
jgi:hypothetical protein